MNKLSYKIVLDENARNSELYVQILFYIDGVHFLPVASPWTVDIVKLLAHGQKSGKLELLVNSHDDSTLSVDTVLVDNQYIRWLRPSNLFLSEIHASYCITADVLYAFELKQYLDTIHKLKQDLVRLEHKLQRTLSLPGNGFYYKDWKQSIQIIANHEYSSEFIQKIIQQYIPKEMIIHFNKKEIYSIPSESIIKFLIESTHGRIELVSSACESAEALEQFLKNIPWDDLDILSWPINDNIPLRSFTHDEWLHATVKFQ